MQRTQRRSGPAKPSSTNATSEASSASTTPLLDRLEHTLALSQRRDQRRQRDTAQYHSQYGPKRIYVKFRPVPGQQRAPRLERARLYARWDRVQQPTGRAHTPERAEKGARQCIWFLQAIGRELVQAKGPLAQPVLVHIATLATVNHQWAPTTDCLRWLAQRLRDCHRGIASAEPEIFPLQVASDSDSSSSSGPTPPATRRRGRGIRLFSLNGLPKARPDTTPPRGALSERARRGSWQPGSGRRKPFED